MNIVVLNNLTDSFGCDTYSSSHIGHCFEFAAIYENTHMIGGRNHSFRVSFISASSSSGVLFAIFACT